MKGSRFSRQLSTWSLKRHTQYCCCAFMIDSFYNSSFKVSLSLIEREFLSLLEWLIAQYHKNLKKNKPHTHTKQNKTKQNNNNRKFSVGEFQRNLAQSSRSIETHNWHKILKFLLLRIPRTPPPPSTGWVD